MIVFINGHYMPGVSEAGTLLGEVIFADFTGRVDVEIKPSWSPEEWEAFLEGRKMV